MLLRLIDAAYLACQVAAKRSGVMDSDEAGVRVEQRPDGPWLVMNRDAEDGWPALRLRLPPGTRQLYAVRGICARGAACASDWPRGEVVAFLRRELDRQGIGFEERVGKRHVELDALQLYVKASDHDRGSRVGIMQKRSGESAPSASKRAAFQPGPS